MFSICGICREQLIKRNQIGINLPSNFSTQTSQNNWEEKSLVSTTCGHLFHSSCLERWFQVEDESGAPWKSCPYCKKIFDESGSTKSHQSEGYHRIFPVSLDEYDTADENPHELKNYHVTSIAGSQGNKESKEIMLGLLKKMHLMEIEMKDLKKSHRGSTKNKPQYGGNNGSGENDTNTRSLKLPRRENILSTAAEYVDDTLCDVRQPMSSSSAQELMKQSTHTFGRENRGLKLGDRVLYRSTSIFAGPMPFIGVVKSLHLNRYGRTIAGVAFEKKIPHGMSPLFFIRQYIDSRPKHYRLIEESRLLKIEPSQLLSMTRHKETHLAGHESKNGFQN